MINSTNQKVYVSQVYQVGCWNDPKEDDPTFNSLDKAMDYISTNFSEKSWQQVYAVWTGQDDGSELLYLYCEGNFFSG